MDKIKFGTDGWRAIIAKEYTVANVARVAEGTARWLKERGDKPSIVLGFDCRFGGQLFAETVIGVMARHNITTHYAKEFVSTPMISLACLELKADLGVIITASHNPPSYNGYKLKANYGGPATPVVISQVEDLIPDETELPSIDMGAFESAGLLQYHDFESMYEKHVRGLLNIDLINDKYPAVAYDAMYGAGQRVLAKLLPKAHILHGDYNPSFMGQAPEPLHKNLLELSKYIADNDHIKFGFATDGDADRIGIYDENGVFVDAHRILLILVHIMHKYKGMDGKVVVSFSVSEKIRRLCAHYGLPCEVTKVGFKYVCQIMNEEDVLVGGEESGGIAVKGHIPERDGIYDALLVLEYLAESGKTVNDLLDEVYEIVGKFSYERDDLHLDNDLKWQIMENCEAGKYAEFGGMKIERIEDIDGYKFYLEGDRSIMIRPSGTEPVLRLYGEAPSESEVRNVLDTVKSALLS